MFVWFIFYFLVEKAEKLNLKFRLAKEGELVEGETESTTFQLVLEQSETDTEAASLTGDNQKTCTVSTERPWEQPLTVGSSVTTVPFAQRRAVAPCHWPQIRKCRLCYGECFCYAWTVPSDLLTESLILRSWNYIDLHRARWCEASVSLIWWYRYLQLILLNCLHLKSNQFWN